MSLDKIPFQAEEIQIRQIFRSGELDSYSHTPVPSEKIRTVCGSELTFPEPLEDRPYIFSSFVTSIDGKLAYADKPSAFYVAGKNMMAGGGKDTDFCSIECPERHLRCSHYRGQFYEDGRGFHAMYCMDDEIESARSAAGLPKIPLNIVMTLDARDVPLDHALLKSREIPCMMR